MPRRASLVLLTVAAVGLAFASAAFACTLGGIQGFTENVTPTSGRPGTTVSATGRLARPNTPFNLHFLNFRSQQDQMGTCMGDAKKGGVDQPIGGPTVSNGSGTIARTSGAIPLTAKPNPTDGSNPALLCFVSAGAVWATTPATFTVLGG